MEERIRLAFVEENRIFVNICDGKAGSGLGGYGSCGRLYSSFTTSSLARPARTGNGTTILNCHPLAGTSLLRKHEVLPCQMEPTYFDDLGVGNGTYHSWRGTHVTSTPAVNPGVRLNLGGGAPRGKARFGFPLQDLSNSRLAESCRERAARPDVCFGSTSWRTYPSTRRRASASMSGSRCPTSRGQG